LVCPSCCSGSGGVEVCVEGGFTDGIGEEIQGIGNELSGVGEGEREGAIGAGAIQQEREPAVVGVDGIGLARCGVCRVEAEDGVGIVRKATALGGQENGGGSVEVLGARGVGVRVEGLRGELFASLEIASYKELLGDAQELLRPPPLAGGGRIMGWGRSGLGFGG
jgi:hypothetical protein